jgi:hypothetical protein
MKKSTLLITSIITVSAFISAFDIMSDNGRAGATGSPGESTCNQANCHTGNSINAAGGSITIDAPGLVNWEYNLGVTYTINVTVARTGINLFGLGFEALTSAGANAGTLAVINSQTTTKNATVLGNSRRSIVHNLNGGASANSHTFTFKWTAPTTNIGNVTFYVAGNAANGNGSVSGDFIYNTSQVVTPIAAAGIAENYSNTLELSVFPNPVVEYVTLNYSLENSGFVTARLIAADGKFTEVLFTEKQQTGKQTKTVELNPGLAKGIYFIEIQAGNNKMAKKVILK